MVFKCNPDILLLPKYQLMAQPGEYFQAISMSRDIEMRAIQLNFRKMTFHKVNMSIFSKMRFIDDNISFSFALDQSISFENQIHAICFRGISQADSYLASVVAIQKAIAIHGKKLTKHIQNYLLSFIFQDHPKSYAGIYAYDFREAGILLWYIGSARYLSLYPIFTRLLQGRE